MAHRGSEAGSETHGRKAWLELHPVRRQHKNGKTGPVLIVKNINIFFMKIEDPKSETVMGVQQILLRKNSNQPVDFSVFPSSYVDLQQLWSESWGNKYWCNSLLLYVQH